MQTNVGDVKPHNTADEISKLLAISTLSRNASRPGPVQTGARPNHSSNNKNLKEERPAPEKFTRRQKKAHPLELLRLPEPIPADVDLKNAFGQKLKSYNHLFIELHELPLSFPVTIEDVGYLNDNK